MSSDRNTNNSDAALQTPPADRQTTQRHRPPPPIPHRSKHASVPHSPEARPVSTQTAPVMPTLQPPDTPSRSPILRLDRPPAPTRTPPGHSNCHPPSAPP